MGTVLVVGALDTGLRARRASRVVVASLLAVFVALAPFMVTLPARAQQAVAVAVVDNAYDPATLQVTAGTTVRWSWTGAGTHSVTGEGFDSHPNCGPQTPEQCGTNGATFSRRFDQQGTVAYGCRIHPTMRGTIVVQPAPSPSPSPSPSPPPPSPSPSPPPPSPSPSPPPPSPSPSPEPPLPSPDPGPTLTGPEPSEEPPPSPSPSPPPPSPSPSPQPSTPGPSPSPNPPPPEPSPESSEVVVGPPTAPPPPDDRTPGPERTITAEETTTELEEFPDAPQLEELPEPEPSPPGEVVVAAPSGGGPAAGREVPLALAGLSLAVTVFALGKLVLFAPPW